MLAGWMSEGRLRQSATGEVGRCPRRGRWSGRRGRAADGTGLNRADAGWRLSSVRLVGQVTVERSRWSACEPASALCEGGPEGVSINLSCCCESVADSQSSSSRHVWNRSRLAFPRDGSSAVADETVVEEISGDLWPFEKGVDAAVAVVLSWSGGFRGPERFVEVWYRGRFWLPEPGGSDPVAEKRDRTGRLS